MDCIRFRHFWLFELKAQAATCQRVVDAFCPFNLDELVAAEGLLVDDAHGVRFGENVQVPQIPETKKGQQYKMKSRFE